MQRALGLLRHTRLLAALAFSAALLSALISSTDGVAAETGTAAVASYRYFNETGQFVSGDFLTFFNRHGGVETFGLPRTGVVLEDGRQVQYFQRARMEFWPDNERGQRVQLTLLGDLLVGRGDPIPRSAVPAGARYYPETGNSLSGEFLRFFDARGGLAVFGYPISEPYQENGRTVQRFQRMVLELWPENPAAFRVQPRLLGDQFALQVKRIPDEWMQPAAANQPPAALVGNDAWFEWASWRSYMMGYYANKRHNMTLASNWLNGTIIYPGETWRYSSVLDARGYLVGLCTGPNSYIPCEAGGACAGATTFYRAWFNAGLEIVQVQNHSYEAYSPLGWDATVYGDNPDLVVRNNSNTPIRILSGIDNAGNNYFIIQGKTPPPWSVQRIGPLQRSAFSYDVGRRITGAAGELISEDWRRVNYAGPPPTQMPPGW